MTFREAVEQYARDLMQGPPMTDPVEDTPIEDLVEHWVLLKFLKEAAEDRMKGLRNELLSRAETYGADTKKGGSKLTIEGSLVLRERRQAALPDEKKLRKLLDDRGIAPDKAFSKVTKVVMDASKVQALVDLGKLPADKVEAMRKVTWALRVKESFDLSDILEAVAGQPGEEMVEAPRDKRETAEGTRKGSKGGGE